VGIAAGCLCHYLSLVPLLRQLPIIQEFSYVVFGAISVGLAIFVMVIRIMGTQYLIIQIRFWCVNYAMARIARMVIN